MKEEISSILFVCLGNICRSPLAEAIAKKSATELGIKLKIDSAAIGNWHVGEPPCNEAMKIACMNGLDIENIRSRQICAKDNDDFDLIVVMDSENAQKLKADGFNDVVKLGNFGLGGEDVPDPYFFHNFEGFANVFALIEQGVNGIFKEFFKEAQSKI